MDQLGGFARVVLGNDALKLLLDVSIFVLYTVKTPLAQLIRLTDAYGANATTFALAVGAGHCRRDRYAPRSDDREKEPWTRAG